MSIGSTLDKVLALANIQTEWISAHRHEAQLTKHIEPYPEVAENTAEYNK